MLNGAEKMLYLLARTMNIQTEIRLSFAFAYSIKKLQSTAHRRPYEGFEQYEPFSDSFLYARVRIQVS